MLSCRDTSDRASDYLDGTLSWRQRIAVRMHLLFCDVCRRYVRQMAATVVALRSVGRSASEDAPVSPMGEAEARRLFRRAR